MLSLDKTQKIQIAFIFAVFVLFLSNTIGILNFQAFTRSNVSLDSVFLSQLFNIEAITATQIYTSNNFIALLVIGAILCLFLPLLNPMKASLLTLICIFIPFIIAFTNVKPPLFPLEYCLMTILILYIVNILMSYFMEVHTRQGIIDAFGRYIPPQLVDEISKSPDKVSMESETRNMTVLFCDLHNFTSSSEHLSPKQISSMLNTYFTAMSKILHAHNATIDKFIGDAVMTFWGAPLPQEDHARLAILASLRMQDEMKKFENIFTANGWPITKMGIGISTGKMHVGNMGSEHRIAYTVVGDPVNLASRLEGLTRTYQVPTIVSESTMQASEDILFRELDTVTVRGKETETRIYQPLKIINELTEEERASLELQLEQQAQALHHYYQDNFSTANDLFTILSATYPEDLYYSVMRDKTAIQ